MLKCTIRLKKKSNEGVSRCLYFCQREGITGCKFLSVQVSNRISRWSCAAELTLCFGTGLVSCDVVCTLHTKVSVSVIQESGWYRGLSSLRLSEGLFFVVQSSNFTDISDRDALPLGGEVLSSIRGGS